MRTVNNRHSGLSPGSLRTAREAAARSARTPSSITGSPSAQGWALPWKASARCGTHQKIGGNHRQQQANRRKAAGEPRSNRTGNGCALFLGKSTRHKPAHGSGRTIERKDLRQDSSRSVESVPGQEGPSFFLSPRRFPMTPLILNQGSFVVSARCVSAGLRKTSGLSRRAGVDCAGHEA